MSNSISGKKGMVLYMVLVSVLVAIVIAGSILNLILSQSRFSHHQASRVQAYYAALAGANYAFERLRSGNEPSCWSTSLCTSSFPCTHYICRHCPNPPVPCTTTCDSVYNATCDSLDDSLPHSVSQVAITVGGTGPGGTLKISSKATYTYTTP